MNWMAAVVELAEGKLLAIDGKRIRRSFEHAWDKIGMAHMVTAFAEHNGQTFAQLKTDGQGGELAAIAKLLGLVDLNGATVTIDAIGDQKAIARSAIRRRSPARSPTPAGNTCWRSRTISPRCTGRFRWSWTT